MHSMTQPGLAYLRAPHPRPVSSVSLSAGRGSSLPGGSWARAPQDGAAILALTPGEEEEDEEERRKRWAGPGGGGMQEVRRRVRMGARVREWKHVRRVTSDVR